MTEEINPPTISQTEAEAILTEFAEIVDTFVKEKGLGSNYAIGVVQGIAYNTKNEGECGIGIMTAKTFLFNGNRLKGRVGYTLSSELSSLAKKILSHNNPRLAALIDALQSFRGNDEEAKSE
jgi:hypothetical protein